MPQPILVILAILVVSIILCVLAFMDADEYEVYERCERTRDDWGIEDAREKNMFALRQANTKTTERLHR